MTTYEEAQQRIRAERRTWLVTGVAGFIGSNLAVKLLELGQTVVGLDNFSTGKRENRTSRPWRGAGGFRFIEGDIRSLDTCREACNGVDLVLHQAALGSVPRSIDEPLDTHDNNVNGFLNMLVAARDAGVPRLVYASSSAVYGDHPALPKVEERIGARRSRPTACPSTSTSSTPACSPRCYGFKSIGLRYFNVFGPAPEPRRPLRLGDPGVDRRAAARPDRLHQRRRQRGARLLLRRQRGAGEPARRRDRRTRPRSTRPTTSRYGEQTSLNELFEIIRTLLAQAPAAPAQRVRAVHREPRRGDMRCRRPTSARPRACSATAPTKGVMDGLESTIDWYMANLAPAEQERKVAHV